MHWNVYKLNRIVPRSYKQIGKVDAESQPEAMLKAFVKFNVKTQDDQRLIFVRKDGWNE